MVRSERSKAQLDLLMAVCRNFIALSGPCPDGNPAYIDSFAETVDEHGARHAKPRSAFARSCEEFVDFFTIRRANALKALPTSQADREHHRKFPFRSTCFRPGTRMYNAFAPVEFSYSKPERRRAVDNCRLACLIYLNAVLLEYGDFSPKTEKFFELFSGFVEDDDLDCVLSAEHLSWSLIRGIEPHDTYERIWKVSRMVGVVKRANQQTWWDIEEALRMLLIMPEDGTKLLIRIAAWDTGRFRKEILSFPDYNTKYSPRQLAILPAAMKQGQTSASTVDIDFLPETRDVQWFPGLTAAAESGVEPHKLYPDVAANTDSINAVQRWNSLPAKQICLPIGLGHNTSRECQVCEITPAYY
jgi:hypothetical protein